MRAITYPFKINGKGAVDSTTDSSKIWVDRMRSVLSTQLGTRVMRSGFGTDVLGSIFIIEGEDTSPLEQAVTDAVSAHLPTVRLQSVTTNFDEDNYTLTVDVVFSAPDSGASSVSAVFDTGGIVWEEMPLFDEEN